MPTDDANKMTDERWKRAEGRLVEALQARDTPFHLATVITACWRYAIGDDEGAAYGLIGDRGDILWKLIGQAIQFERDRVDGKS
jgi:hypothetical protein